MTSTRPWVVLVIDDEERVLARLKETIEAEGLGDGAPVDVVCEKSFDNARVRIQTHRVDLVVLDVRDAAAGDDDAGRVAFAALQEEVFAPVVFYTGIANRVTEFEAAPAVTVVRKSAGAAGVVKALREAVESGLPALVRGVDSHVAGLMRAYFWESVVPDWSHLKAATSADRAAFVVQRLAKSLDATRQDTLIGPLRDLVGPVSSPWHAAYMYVAPPLAAGFETGDVCRDRDNGDYYVLLTPVCDLAVRHDGQRKAEFVKLARAIPLEALPQYVTWCDGGMSKDTSALKDVVSGKNERYFYLPPLLHLVPELVVDLQQTMTRHEAELERFDRVAGLAAPYPQILSARNARYMGRLGYEDVPVGEVIDRWRADRTAAQAKADGVDTPGTVTPT